MTIIGPKKCVDMRKVLFITTLIMCAFGISAQDVEFNKLVDMVNSLKTGGEAAFNSAVKTLANDKLWTPLNENLNADNPDAECVKSERVPGFRLNKLMNHAEDGTRHQATYAGFLNGADSRFNYSLIERAIRPGMSVTLTLPNRWGEQIIIIIPYDGEKAKISAKASGNGDFSESSAGSGCIKLTGNVDKGTPLKLKIANGSKENRSYVIINYNSHQ